MTSINGIAAPLWESISPAEQMEQKPAEGSIFGDIFHSAINTVRETDAEKNQAEYLLATGQLDNPAVLTIASTKAETSVQLLVQLRNKAMDSYNELMRISL